jgi:enoyl-CoA hydratase/carnithine racemase
MSFFRTEDHQGTLLVTLDRPPYNALIPELLDEGTAMLIALADAPPAAGIVLTGAGDNFTRGMDVKYVAALNAAGDRDGGRAAAEAVNRFTAALHRLPCAVVGAINGHAIGAGGIMALACDWVVAASGDYKIGLPEAKAGLPFPAVPQLILDHWLDPVWRRRLALSSMLLGPEAAITAGLADEIAAPDALVTTAITRAQELSAQPGFAACKEQLRAVANADIEAVLE